MAERLEPIGVEAIAKGVGSFLSSMRQMEDAFDRTSAKLDGFAPAAGAATASIGSIAGGVGLAIGGLKLLEGAFNAVTSAVKATASAITGFIGEGMRMAGTFQEMEFAALAVGRSMGLQEEEIRGAIDALNEAGIRYDVAAKAVGQFAKNQIDLAKATDLANIAQGAAIFLGEDSSATMQRLTHAIVSGSQETFRAMNITVRLGQEYEKFAKANDRAVESLTEQERVQIRVNAVIENSAALLDVYNAAMDSPTKKLRSLTGRELPELQAALGAPFLDAWSIAIQAVRDFVNALTDAMKEGGALYPILVNLGAVASLVAEGFANALGVVTDFVTGLKVDLDTGMSETVSGMLQWGIEIVAALAEGIVSASSTLLVGAMNAISNTLTFWLGAASAPKVAPGLVKWGVAAMSEYLHGFTLADFSVLEKIQAPLKQVLEGPAFADLSAEMIKAVSAGEVDETFFERIAQAAGEFGTEIAELARLQLQLADATRQVAEADKKVTDGRQKVSDLTAEYNKLLRAGASKDILKAKLAEINAAEEGVEVAKDQRKEAKERISGLEEEAKIQDKLVSQLIGLGKAAVPPAVAAAAAERAPRVRKLGKPEAIIPEIVMPEAAEFDIASRISQAIDEAKAVMAEKLADLFQPFTDAWENLKTGPLAEIGTAFSDMWTVIQKAWDTFWDAFSIGWGDMDTVFQNFITDVGPALQEVWDALRELWDKVAESLGLADVDWGNLIERLGNFAGSTTAQFITDFLDAVVLGLEDFADAVDWVSERIEIWQGIIDNLNVALESMSLGEILSLGTMFDAIDLPDWLESKSPTLLEIGIRGIMGALSELGTVTEGFFAFEQMRLDLEQLVMVLIPLFVSDTILKFTTLKDTTIRLVSELTSRIIQLFRGMATRVIQIIREMVAQFLSALAELREGSEEILTQVAEVFEAMAERMAESVRQITSEIDRINAALDKLIIKADEAYEKMKKAGLIDESPSRLELGLRGAAQAMRQLSMVEMPKLSAAMTRVPGPAAAYAPIAAAGGVGGANVSVPITANIYNDMDAEAFYIRVEQAVTRAVNRRW